MMSLQRILRQATYSVGAAFHFPEKMFSELPLERVAYWVQKEHADKLRYDRELAAFTERHGGHVGNRRQEECTIS